MRKNRFIIMVLAFVAMLLIQSATISSTVPPLLRNGFVNQITVLGKTIVVSGYPGQVYLSPDAGQNWTDVSSVFGTTVWGLSLVMFKDTLFAATDSGVFQSADNGNHWKAFNEGLISHIVSALLVHDSSLYCASDSVYKYNAPLRVWQKVGSGSDEASTGGRSPANLSGLTANDSALFCSRRHQDDIFSLRYDDSTKIWHKIFPYYNPISLVSIGNVVLCGNKFGMVVRSTGYGMHWDTTRQGCVDCAWPMDVCLLLRGDRCYLGQDRQIEGANIMTSIDTGRTWLDTRFNIIDDNVRDLANIGDTILAGTENGLIMSRDGFQTWWQPGDSALATMPSHERINRKVATSVSLNELYNLRGMRVGMSSGQMNVDLPKHGAYMSRCKNYCTLSKTVLIGK